MHVVAQEILCDLIEEELQIQSAGIRQGGEARQSVACAPHHHVAEMRPIDLRLLAGKSAQTKERLMDLRPPAADGAP